MLVGWQVNSRLLVAPPLGYRGGTTNLVGYQAHSEMKNCEPKSHQFKSSEQMVKRVATSAKWTTEKKFSQPNWTAELVGIEGKMVYFKYIDFCKSISKSDL